MKKIISALLSIMMIFSMATASFASELPNEEPQFIVIDMELDYDTATVNADGTVTYDILNFEELSAAWGIDASSIKSAKYVAINQSEESYPSPQASITIENISGPREACGTKEICRNSATNRLNKPITKSITLTGTVSNTYSLSVESGIDVEVASISAAVGFDVTAEWSMSDSTEVDLEPGETVNVKAIPLYDIYSYDVYYSSFWTGNKKIGTGTAVETVGFCTVTY
jgi:hypothetical protein